MLSKKLLQRLSVAIAFATLSSFFVVGASSAQVSSMPVVRVESPATGTSVNGTATFTGLAVDCATGVAATRVAVNDNTANGPYLADVSMDTSRPVAVACPTRTGNAQIGFTLILDTRRLGDGRHTLFFTATFPGGGTSTVSTEIWVDNRAVFGNPCGYSYSAYCGGGSYANGYYPNGYIPNGYYAGAGVVVPGGYIGGGYTSCMAYNSLGVCQIWSTAPGGIYPGQAYANGLYVNNQYGTCGNYANGCPVLSNPRRVVQPCVGAPWRSCVYSSGGFTVSR
jgi:hypothetical protein